MIPLGIADAWSSADGGLAHDAPGVADAGRRRRTGCALLLFAIAMNVPFALLAATFDYPDVLRRGAEDVLPRFHGGGVSLLWQWYAYAAVAAAFVPLSLAVRRSLRGPRCAMIGTTLAGVLAGVFQVLGLLRWVFVVPALAAAHVDPQATEATRAAAVQAFTLVHQLFGVAIGEHLGQLATAGWTLGVARALGAQPWCPRWLRWPGVAAGVLLVLGQAEALATVVPFALGPLALAVPVGFLLWSLWLAALGIVLVLGAGRGERRCAAAVHAAVAPAVSGSGGTGSASNRSSA